MVTTIESEGLTIMEQTIISERKTVGIITAIELVVEIIEIIVEWVMKKDRRSII